VDEGISWDTRQTFFRNFIFIPMSLQLLYLFSLLLDLLNFQVELIVGFPLFPELAVLGPFSFGCHPAQFDALFIYPDSLFFSDFVLQTCQNSYV
jgi:hypothetical protein